MVLGLFTVNSAMGVISPGQSVVITVECVADKPGKHEEVRKGGGGGGGGGGETPKGTFIVCINCPQDLCVEISDQHKNDPQITYKIRGEVLVPAINTSDISSVFEEHRICKQLGILGQHKFHEVREGRKCIVT